MYYPVTTTRFDKDLKRVVKRGNKMAKLKVVMRKLANGEVLDMRYRDHSLTGNYTCRRECHIEPDWLLIYCIRKETNEIIFERTGSHADLF